MKNLILLFLIAKVIFCNSVFAQSEYLMVVDVQKQFYENTKMEQRANEMIENINLLIDKYDAQNVIYIKTEGKMLSISFKGIKTEPMIPNPELDEKIKLVNENVFTKNVGNSFMHEQLIDFLQKNSAKSITVVGLLASQCIYRTALGGIEKGYQITVVPEAILGKTVKKKAKAIRKMTEKGVDEKSIKEIL